MSSPNFCKNPVCCKEIPENKEYCCIACQLEDESLDNISSEPSKIKINPTKEKWQ